MSECRQTLRLKDFEVWCHLGCSPEEQARPQAVLFSLEIGFLKNLGGSTTDLLEDAIDYVELTNIIHESAREKKFHLIEHLNQYVFDRILQCLRKKDIRADVGLTIRKIRIPIANLLNGAEFSCQQTLS